MGEHVSTVFLPTISSFLLSYVIYDFQDGVNKKAINPMNAKIEAELHIIKQRNGVIREH